ncbi:MAG: histidine kinase dimerization/phosphoacceptor domain -containing protein [Balneolaceae bacterium]
MKKVDDRFLFHELLANTSDSIYFKDKKCRFIFCSQYLAQKHGVQDVDELIGKTDFDIFSDEHAQQAFEDEQKIMHTGEPIIGIVEKETFQDGKIQWSSTSKFPLIGPDKQIIGTFGISRNITAQKLAEEELKANKEKIQQALKEKKILLAEVHHRVKNNLAVILGLIELQRYKLQEKNEPVPDVLLSTKTRIKSIANVHELLYQTENFAGINIKDLMVKLSEDTKASYNSERKKIDFKLEIEDIVLNTNQAIPLCLLMNEHILNSYKHAFNNKKHGLVTIIAELNNDEVSVTYKDNGNGFDGDFDEILESGNSLGLTLITALGSQLEAENISHNVNKGFTYQFTFRVDNKSESNSFISGGGDR